MSMELNWIDISFLLIFIISFSFGVIRGFIRSVVSLLFLILAVYLALKYTPSLAAYFSSSTGKEQITSDLLLIGLFLLIFIITIVIGALVSYFLSLVFHLGGLGFIDSFLGGLFGIVRAFILSAVLIYLLQWTPISEQPQWKESTIVMHSQPVMEWLVKNVPIIETWKEKVSTTVQGLQVKKPSAVNQQGTETKPIDKTKPSVP